MLLRPRTGALRWCWTDGEAYLFVPRIRRKALVKSKFLCCCARGRAHSDGAGPTGRFISLSRALEGKHSSNQRSYVAAPEDGRTPMVLDRRGGLSLCPAH